MAGEIFISYRRADEAWARLLHSLLQGEGVEAWYDAQIGVGQDWRIATAKALEASQIFVLLFTSNAAQSSDIAKELAAAVQEKKLIVPVRLEDIAPKGAFLYELASRNWVNAYENPDAKLAELAKGLAHLVRTGARDESVLPFDRSGDSGQTPARSPRKSIRTRALVAAATVVAMALAGAGFLFYPRPAPSPAQPTAARVAVLPFDTLSDSTRARHFAGALTDEIVTRLNSNRIQVVSRDDAATLRGANRDAKIVELGVALLFDGTVEDNGDAMKVRVHLDDPVRHVTLWSGAADGPAARSDQLQAVIAGEIVAVLACSNRALAPVHGLTDPDLLSRYLHACDIFVNGLYSSQQIYELLGSLRDVAAKAPDFTPAHSDFAKFGLYLSAVMPPEQAVPLRREAEAEAHKTIALDPKSPDGHLALSWLLPVTDWAGREKLLRQGVAGDPDWPHTNGFLGKMLAETGQLRQAAGFLQRAAAADLQIDWRPENAWLQCGSGQFEPATGFLQSLLKLKPGNPSAWGRLRKCLLFARRWADLRALTQDGSSRPSYFTAQSAAFEDVYLAAEETGKPADVARARAQAFAAPGGGNAPTANAIEALSALGLVDDAFTLANRYTPGAALTNADSAFLFYPLTAPMRRDPRFIQLAARLRLVDYWRSSGKWPDFCGEPGLPYNCRTEAGKLKPAQ
ncbi:MAG TPA: TIR domain-containing protein [Rhizomicrobium sp.]|nr:TIR domain-containing protein [Rhizomicrobium sp.]